ncbi:ABC transporter ATP-binding protein [Modestobacter italicus]|uniref:ABC transporter ATP-binding protein n=1 Tax=Modestobacter italicus (strain DSM 44449 / CECT 9708 / BC 501) TaxID=2732864 RepID=UPI001C952760|nr:ATP-binding cassette domain-containing protein [Modestobacter italicus]
MLALDQISKAYGSHQVLDDVSLQVRRGEVLGYVGGNGAGKTTSMRIVLGVATADSGRVTLDGVPVDAAARARMGYMPEERGLYPTMRVQQQLEFFAELRGLSRPDAARAATYWLDRLGVGSRRDSALEDLSLGNQQRVQLAAALVHGPEALVLDEPFSGLDPLAVDVMAEVLREEAARGVPVVFSSHQLDLVERTCDRVAVLHGGRLVADGTVEGLTGGDGRRWLLRSDASPAAWAADLDPDTRASVEPAHGDAVTVRLAGDEDLGRVVDAVRRHGTLRELRPWRPSLTEVYRDVVHPGPVETGPAHHELEEQAA